MEEDEVEEAEARPTSTRSFHTSPHFSKPEIVLLLVRCAYRQNGQKKTQ